MKSPLIWFFLISVSCLRLLAADEGNTTFEAGLLEEDANHNLDAAILNYRGSLSYYSTNRQMLATALFRLGECYRKQGKISEARIQYRRILHNFSDQTNLV